MIEKAPPKSASAKARNEMKKKVRFCGSKSDYAPPQNNHRNVSGAVVTFYLVNPLSEGVGSGGIKMFAPSYHAIGAYVCVPKPEGTTIARSKTLKRLPITKYNMYNNNKYIGH